MKVPIKLILAITIVLLAFVSCKKSDNKKNNNNNPSPYYINFKVNGDQQNNSKGVKGLIQTDGTNYQTLITLNDTTRPANPTLTILIVAIKPLTAGDIYTTIPDNNSGSNFMGLRYDDNVYSYGTSDTTSTLTITAVTSTTIKGTFSGKMTDDTGDHSVTIIDGKFNVKYTQQMEQQNAMKLKRNSLSIKIN